MTASILVAQRGTYDATTGIVLVRWPLPTGIVPQAILFGDIRYVPTVPGIVWSVQGPVAPASVRIEIPGTGPIAADLEIYRASVGAIMRGNGERSIYLRIDQPVPPPDPTFSWTQISLRFLRFPDQPKDATAGLTQRQALAVIA